MNRIHNFSSFSRLYEAEEGEKKISDFQNLIQMSVANILSCYKNQTLMSKEKWLKLIPDYDSIIAAPGVDSFKKILDAVKSSAADDAKDTAEAWSKAGSSFIGVLSKIYELMPNNKDAINRIISDYIKNTSKPNLKSATEDNPAKEAADKAEKEAAQLRGQGVALFRQEVAKGMTEAAEEMKQANLDTNVILFSMWTEAIKNFAEYGKGNVIFLDGSPDGMNKTMKQMMALITKPKVE